MRLLDRLSELSWPERKAACEAWAFLIGTTVALRLFGFGAVRKRLLGFEPPAQSRIDRKSAQQLARVVSGAAAWSAPRPNCLSRALVLCRLLQRRGLEGVLHLGVEKPLSGFGAHAWVEHDGVPLGERETVSTRYRSLKASNASTPGR